MYVVDGRDWWQAVLRVVMNLISGKGTVLLDKMSYCQFLEDSALWSWLGVCSAVFLFSQEVPW
jgi:hypothetical protein